MLIVEPRYTSRVTKRLERWILRDELTARWIIHASMEILQAGVVESLTNELPVGEVGVRINALFSVGVEVGAGDDLSAFSDQFNAARMHVLEEEYVLLESFGRFNVFGLQSLLPQ